MTASTAEGMSVRVRASSVVRLPAEKGLLCTNFVFRGDGGLLSRVHKKVLNAIYTDLQDISRLTAVDMEGSPMHFRLRWVEGTVERASLPASPKHNASHCTVRTCASGVPILLLGGVWGGIAVVGCKECSASWQIEPGTVAREPGSQGARSQRGWAAKYDGKGGVGAGNSLGAVLGGQARNAGPRRNSGGNQVIRGR